MRTRPSSPQAPLRCPYQVGERPSWNLLGPGAIRSPAPLGAAGLLDHPSELPRASRELASSMMNMGSLIDGEERECALVLAIVIVAVFAQHWSRGRIA